MKVTKTALPGLLLLEPHVFEDERGYFVETYNARTFREATDIDCLFVQDNCSRSRRGVLRGLHYQIVHPQAKLIRCIAGEVLEVAVDLRRSSRFFGRWTSFLLSPEKYRMAWIPAGFGHGFVVRSREAEINYKVSDFYAPQYERCIAWNDPDLAIDWQLDEPPVLSAKDSRGLRFCDAEVYD